MWLKNCLTTILIRFVISIAVVVIVSIVLIVADWPLPHNNNVDLEGRWRKMPEAMNKEQQEDTQEDTQEDFTVMYVTQGTIKEQQDR